MSVVKGSIRKHGNRWHWTLIIQGSNDHATVFFDNEKTQQLAMHMLEVAYRVQDRRDGRGWPLFAYRVKEVNYIGFDNYDQVA